MGSSGPFAGVISPELCWSAHGNELRVHSTARLEPHAGHKTTGLPVQALFRFLSEPARERERERERERGPVRGTVLPPSNKRAKLLQPQTLAVGSGAIGQSVCVADSRSVITSTTGAATGIASKPGAPGSPKDAAGISPQPGNGRQRAAAGSPPVGGGPRRGSPTFSPVGSGGFPRKRGGTSRNAAGKLSVRVVEAFELRDGRTVLLCLASERELPSEVHCVDPFSGETLHVATGLPILLTSLAVVPRLALPSQGRHCHTRQEGGGGGGAARSSSGGDAGLSSSSAAAAATASGSPGAWTDAAAAAATAEGVDGGDAEELVVAVGGVGGRVTLLALQIPQRQQQQQQQQQQHGGKRGRDSSSIRRCPFRSWPAPEERFGGVPSEREGVPVTSLSAFSVAVVAGDGEDRVPPGRGVVVVAMVAAGWSDGSWAVAPCCCSRPDSSCGGIDADSSSVAGIGDAWAEACSPLSGDLATGDTGGLGPALHFVCQENTVPRTLSPVGEPCTKLRLWVTTASGFLCFQVLLAGGRFSWPQAQPPLITRQRSLIPGVRPQSLRAMAVGGGRSLPVMIFASFRPSDGSPVLIVLDTDTALAAATAVTATAAAAASGFATMEEKGKNPEPRWSSSAGRPVGGGGGGGCLQDGRGGAVVSGEGGEGGDEHEVELATRCCSKSVFPARPHAVFVDPAEVKAFVCRRRRRRWSYGDDGVVVAPGSSALAPPFPARSPSHEDKDKLHLKFPVILAEASLDETGRPRLRAWEQSHAGFAHKVAVDAEVLGLLAYCDPSEEDLDADTAHDVNALGEASLDHVVGGPDNLWARPFFEPEYGNGQHNSAVAGAAPSPLMLLAARLQGAVALGRGPAVARSLTAIVLPRGGEWMLPRARPVQEWAAAVALEAWDEASSLTAALLAPPGSYWPSAPWLDDVSVTLEALARRSRQAERILEASIERCRQYCEAATASYPEPVPVGVLRLRRRRPNLAATQRLEAARLAETAPLLSRLRRAALAARLALRVSSAAAWILVSGLGRPTAAASVGVAEPSATAGGEESSATVAGSLPGLVRPIPVHAATAAAAAVVAPTVRLLERLRERGGLSARAGVRRQDKAPRRRYAKADEKVVVGSVVTAGDDTGDGECCPSGGGAGAPLAVLAEMTSLLRGVFVAAGEEGFEDVDGVLGSGVGGGAEKLGEALGSLLERGLAVVAYSVMDTAFSRGGSSRTATGGALSIDHAREPDQEAQERAVLGTAETVFDRFCEQVRLTPEVRIQARLSWLLDIGAPGKAGSRMPASSSSVCVSTAAAALLCPKASACLAADPDLLAMAGAVLARHGGSRGAGDSDDGGDGGDSGGGGGGSSGSGGGDGGEGVAQAGRRRPAAFLPLAEELLRAAGGPARDRLRERVRNVEEGGSGPLLFAGGRAGAGARQTVPPPYRRGGEADGTGSEPEPDLRDVQEAVSDAKQQQQQQQQQQPQQQQQQQQPQPQQYEQLLEHCSSPTDSMRRRTDGSAPRRDRGCTVWETPRGVGLTPTTTPAARRASPLSSGPRRDRGCTLWETPRGVGLTPKTTLGAQRGTPFAAEAEGIEGLGRARGQTVWETPRGVGLTPKTPRAQNGMPVETTDAEADGLRHQARARGQTVWETPRGVGLTPKAAGAGPIGSVSSAGGGGSAQEDDCRYRSSAHGQLPRPRGQTVWETPRGVGLTPKTVGDLSSRGHMPAGGVGSAEENCHSSASSAHRQQPRARGQTVWETPRGVGLTPKVTGHAVWGTATTTPLSATGVRSSPGAWSAASRSSASPVVDGQREMRSYAQGAP